MLTACSSPQISTSVCCPLPVLITQLVQTVLVLTFVTAMMALERPSSTEKIFVVVSKINKNKAISMMLGKSPRADVEMTTKKTPFVAAILDF